MARYATVLGNLDDDTIDKVSEYASLGMSYSSIATVLGVTAATLSIWRRLGEASAILSEAGLEDDEIAGRLGSESEYVSRARSLYQAIELGRALGEAKALRSLDRLVSGYSQDDLIPAIPSSLSAIKLRLQLSNGYQTDNTNQTGNIVSNDRLQAGNDTIVTIDDLQYKRQLTIEASSLPVDDDRSQDK